MLFYKADCQIGLKVVSDDEKEWELVKARLASDCMLQSTLFNEKHRKEGAVFALDWDDGHQMRVGIMDFGEGDPEALSKAFLDSVGVRLESFQKEEITLRSLIKLLYGAGQQGFLDDPSEILSLYQLDDFNDRYGSSFSYEENLIGKMSKKEIYEHLPEGESQGSLRDEVDRIFAGKKRPYLGHPVHYIIQSDDTETATAMASSLLEALYANGRLKSRRYFFLTRKPERSSALRHIRDMYRISEGGAIVIRWEADRIKQEDSFFSVSDPSDFFTTVAQIAGVFHQKVLTIFLLENACKGERKAVFETIGTGAVMEIRERDLKEAEARKYLAEKARREHVRLDKKLYQDLASGSLYRPSELDKMYARWYDEKLRTVIYPQYKKIPSAMTLSSQKPVEGSAYADLQKMVGLTRQKELIAQIIAYAKVQKLYQDRGVKNPGMSMHMVFTGNPGTAKTTVARLVGQILRQEKVLQGGQMIEVGRADLVGRYVGWTAPKVKEAFVKAKGGVLFLDEAYSLVDGRRGDYGDEAINTIVQEMENAREDTVVIFAGYPKPMEEFLNTNPGIRSRIAYHIDFPDYSTEELVEIARLQAAKMGRHFSENALQKLSLALDKARKVENFGNGRCARNFVEKAIFAQARRLAALDPADVTDNDLKLLTEDDVDLKAAQIPKPERPQMGFLAG